MTTMKIRDLTRTERAVFMAIAEQSKMYPDEPFAYDVKEGQIYINNLGVTVDRDEHMETIRNLAEDEIIDADWLVPCGDDSGSSEITICDFARGRDWAKEKFATDLIVPYTQSFDDYYYINIHPSKVRAIKGTFTIMCEANVFPGNDPLTLRVHCETKNGAEDYVLRVFDDEKRPYLITNYALKESFKRPGEKIYRKELNEKIRDENNKELIRSDVNIPKVFFNNATVKTILSPLIKLKSDYILIKKDVKLTRPQYEAIKMKASSD